MEGPILILGANGFIGSAIFKHLNLYRDDVFGTVTRANPWRIGKVPNLIPVDLLTGLEWLLLGCSPRTIINCAAYGSFPSEKLGHKIYATNFELVSRILHSMDPECAYIHAGTSSEYGYNSAAPTEDECLTPNSEYAVSKASASLLIEYFGKHKGYKCCNLRLYSVYGPLESYNRLMPQLVASAAKKQLPQFVSPTISRDFVHIDDVIRAFTTMGTLAHANESIRGQAYNICTGVCTNMLDLASLSREAFELDVEPDFTMPARDWDKECKWFGNSDKSSKFWTYRIGLRAGILGMYDWFKGLSEVDKHYYILHSKK